MGGRAEYINKFKTLATGIVSEEEQERFLAAVQNLDNLTDLSELNVVVVDEIQAGMMRTGSWFASDHEGIVPDLVTIAKGIASGIPLAMVSKSGTMPSWSEANQEPVRIMPA